MNSSDGNISGQARGFQRKIVPVGCRYGCNQRDDNRYYRVNPTHPADLGGVIPLPLLPRLLFATVGAKAASVTRMMYPPFPFPLPSVLFISRKRRSWNTQPREIEIRPSRIPEYSRLWFLIWARPSIVETMRSD